MAGRPLKIGSGGNIEEIPASDSFLYSPYDIVSIDSGDSPYAPSRMQGHEVILSDATSGNITITLPTATGNKAMFTIQKTDSSANTVDDGTNTILFQYTSYSVVSDGSAWVRIF